jgi:hypothetical protein
MQENVRTAEPPPMQNFFLLTLPQHALFEVCYETSPYSDNPTSTLCAMIRVGIASGEMRNSSVSTVTGLHTGCQRTIGLTSGRMKICITSPKLPERLCGPFGGKRPGNEAHYFHLVPRLRTGGSIPLHVPRILRVQVLLDCLSL